MGATEETIKTVADMAGKYTAGFVTDIETEKAPKGLNEDIIRFISAKKGEPKWMLDWRLKAYVRWLDMPEPQWQKPEVEPFDYQDAYYYAAPKDHKDGPKTIDDVDPKLLETYAKLGIPLREQEILAGVQERSTPVAVDVVFDSVSVATTFKDKLAEVGVIFCSISEAIKNHPDLIKKYIGSVVPPADNKHACLNSAVFTDGSFVYIPEGVRCPMELSTYFRINELNTGQFERTLIIAEKG
ncbi:MAG: Fe-S cluster assembly protein SufB, partial [Micavibrio sp.]|nr:Fe-S cluster assembly protein SufB [Micavibrio sp.]